MTSTGYSPPESVVSREKIGWAALFFVIAVFFIASQEITYSAQFTSIREGSAESVADVVEQGSVSRRIALLSLAGFGVVGLWRQRRSLRSTVHAHWPLMLFVGASAATILWADDRLLTARRVVVLIAMCLGAFAIATCGSLRRIVVLAFAGSLIYLLLGVVCELALGMFSPFGPEYRFCGTLHPNHQAWNCALLLLSSLALSRVYRRKSILFLAVALMAVVFLYLTKSRTALGACIISLGAYSAVGLSRLQKIAVTMGACNIILFLFLMGGQKSFEAHILAGRDPGSTYTLTGRIPLWLTSLEYVRQRPIEGYGFNAFWTTAHIMDVSSELGWGVPESHSGYVELLLGVGVPGTVLYLLVLAQGHRRMWYAYSRTHDPCIGFAAALMVFYTIAMIAEVIAFAPSLPTFIVFVLLFLHFGHSASNSRLQTHRA